MPLDQMSDHSNFQVSGFAAGWQSHMVQTLASFGDGRGGPSQGGALLPNDEGLPACCLTAEQPGAAPAYRLRVRSGATMPPEAFTVVTGAFWRRGAIRTSGLPTSLSPHMLYLGNTVLLAVCSSRATCPSWRRWALAGYRRESSGPPGEDVAGHVTLVRPAGARRF